MGAPEKSSATGANSNSNSNSNSMQRVKVYRLNDDGKWDDQGTGHVTIDYVEGSEHLGLFVIDEEDSETLLLHRICSEDIYRKQEDTIISWRDPEYASELALSFQESVGCTHIWDHIGSAQRNLQFRIPNDETSNNRSELKELPPVELSMIPLISKIVTESGNADQLRLIELVLNDRAFFKKLMEIFRVCEDLDNKDGLHMIYKIVKGIILLNSSQIFEKIFGDDLLMDIIGSLEYDPEVQKAQHHRDFLKEHVVFKEAIPIKDPIVLSKIHQTYRIGYLKDIILPKVLDEATVSNLNSIIHSNNAIVVSLLKDDNAFIQELFARLKSPATSTESKRNLVFFLHEFCSLSKSLQMVQQIRLFRDLINEGIFDVVTTALQSDDKRLVLTGTDILILFLNQDPNLLRNYIIRQDGNLLLELLVSGLVTDFGENMSCQFIEIIRSLLDSFTLPANQRDTVVEIFYEKHLSQLVDVIRSSCPLTGDSCSSSTHVVSDVQVEIQNSTKPEILSNICDLLCFCVLHHPYRIKCNFLLNNLVEGVLFLTRRRERYLVVSAVRFVRTILSRHDEHLINHFVKKNILKPVVEAFVANEYRYNLLNSAVLDLFEFIRKENLLHLVTYVVDSFWNQLVRFENFVTIRSLKIKYEQVLEDIGKRSNSNPVGSHKQPDERALDKDEETYFNENSDEEDTASASHSNKEQSRVGPSNGVVGRHPSTSSQSAGLVDDDDDDDDDDDEDCRPPPNKHSKPFKDDGSVVKSHKLKRKFPSVPKESELTGKKQMKELDLKSDATDAVPSCSTICEELLSEETIFGLTEGLPHSQRANERSNADRLCEEEPGSEEICNVNQNNVGVENSYGGSIEGKSACEKNGSNNHVGEEYLAEETRQNSCSSTLGSTGYENSNDVRHREEDPASQKSSFDTRVSTEENKDKTLCTENSCLDGKNSVDGNKQAMEPGSQKIPADDENSFEENHMGIEPSDGRKLGQEDCLAIQPKPSPELSSNGP